MLYTRHTRQNGIMLLIYGITFCLLLSGCQLPTGNGTTVTTNTQAPPVISKPAIDTSLKDQGTMQLQTFQQWITVLKQNGGDATSYQQQYTTDQQALQNAKTPDAYKAALTTTTSHVDAIQLPAMKTEAQYLQQKLKKQVDDWGQQHTYYNAYDNKHYPLNNSYGDAGIGGWVQNDLDTAKTMADYQQAIENLNMYLINFQAMVNDAQDKTAFDQPHQTDLELMKQYGRDNKKVIVISLYEQVMRIYDSGKLVQVYKVTTGRPERPTPPGNWWVEGRQTNITFHSSDPKSSPFWYADTHINFALPFHSGGYFIHDSWWRADYGFGTDFPHPDSSGENVGSHGCVNLPTNEAEWLYNFVQLYTGVIIY
jgi:L,D-transpeptidase catalytic domain